MKMILYKVTYDRYVGKVHTQNTKHDKLYNMYTRNEEAARLDRQRSKWDERRLKCGVYAKFNNEQKVDNERRSIVQDT